MGEIHEERETNSSNAKAAPYVEICLKDAADAQSLPVLCSEDITSSCSAEPESRAHLPCAA